LTSTHESSGGIKRFATIVLALAFTVAVGSLGTVIQSAHAHGLNVVEFDVHEAGERGVTIVLGHANEPTYGAKPGIHDGKHGVEVLLEDTATALPLSGADLNVDKYYFSDFRAFSKAKSVNDATEIDKGVELAEVFGDPGHYAASQVQKDGIYGYRLYGTIDYFSAETVEVDTTVFCTSEEGDTDKFDSAGWFGGFGCTVDIDDVLFPEKNNDVNPSNTRRAELDSGAGQLTDISTDSAAELSQGSAATGGSPEVVELAQTAPGSQLALLGLPIAAVAGILGWRKLRNRDEDG
jgi:hypothetical protein